MPTPPHNLLLWTGHLHLWIMLLFLSGCTMIGPDFSPPEAPVAPKCQESKGTYTRSDAQVTDSRWWDVFHDPVLNKLIELAYQQNLTLQIAGLRVLEARAQLGVVAGSLYPQVQQATGSYSYNRGAGAGAEPYFSGASIGFDAGWELDFWGKFRRYIRKKA